MDYNMNPESNENSFQNRAKRFFDKQGFTVVLIVCLLILGVTAVMSYRGLRKESEQAKVTEAPTWMPSPSPSTRPVSVVQDQSLEDSLTSPSASADASQTPEQSPSSEPTPDATATPAPEKSSEKKKSPSLFPMPVDGEVLQPFAGDTLIYSKTLDQWTSHMGIDIAGEEGSSVKCIDAGVVDRVDNDPLMGFVIVVKHSDDIDSLYANLKDLPTLRVGDSVKAGDIVGKIGTSAIAEREEAPHLHFELFSGGSAVNPTGRLTGLAKIEDTE